MSNLNATIQVGEDFCQKAFTAFCAESSSSLLAQKENQPTSKIRQLFIYLFFCMSYNTMQLKDNDNWCIDFFLYTIAYAT